ncbi:hypothetical protein D3C75_1081880 [compost metagenome]
MALFIRSKIPSVPVNSSCTSGPSFLSFIAAVNLELLNSRVPSFCVLIPNWLSVVSLSPAPTSVSTLRISPSSERVVGSLVSEPSTRLSSASRLVDVSDLIAFCRVL